MVDLKTIRSANKTLVDQPLVAVFSGATSGIGSYAVKSLAATHGDNGKDLGLYIIGRNDGAAKDIISECLAICPKGDFRFQEANDLSLLRDMDRVAAQVMKSEEAEAKKFGGKAKIDFLVMTHAYLAFEARKETKEGLDKLMSLLYYSRMRFITQFLPLLLASTNPTGAHVVSVFGPMRDEKLFPKDLSLRNPKNYGFMNMGSHVTYLTTFFFEKLVAQHPDKLSLIHYFPGLVYTKAMEDPALPSWFRWTFKLSAPLMKFWMVPGNECGERVIFLASERFPARGARGGEGKAEAALASDGAVGGGAYRVDWDGGIIPLKKNYPKIREEEMAEKCCEHTARAFEVIEAGGVFNE